MGEKRFSSPEALIESLETLEREIGPDDPHVTEIVDNELAKEQDYQRYGEPVRSKREEDFEKSTATRRKTGKPVRRAKKWSGRNASALKRISRANQASRKVDGENKQEMEKERARYDTEMALDGAVDEERINQHYDEIREQELDNYYDPEDLTYANNEELGDSNVEQALSSQAVTDLEEEAKRARKEKYFGTR